MKNITIIFLLSIFIKSVEAQNLIPNPSFEDKVQCPYQNDTLLCLAFDTSNTCVYWSSESTCFDSVLIGWSSYGDTPNYFNSCANVSRPECGVPNNIVGRQAAIDGDAYVGIGTVSFWPLSGPNAREYIGTPLLTPLTIGIRYYVSAYICRSVTHYPLAQNVGGANNNLGFRFSTVSFSQHDSVLINNFAHVNDTTIITDSIGWTRISGSFIADSAYEYVALGNFFDDAHTDTMDIFLGIGLQFNHAYYLIDQVCVSTDSLTCKLVTGNEEINKSRVNLYPNPVSGLLKAEVDDEKEVTLIIYDKQLKKVLQQSFFKSAYMNTENLEPGIYFYTLTGKEGMIKTGKLVMMEE